MRTVLSCAALAAASIAWADTQAVVVDAPVVGVDPIVQVVTDRIPHETCRDERVKVVVQGGHGHSTTPPILGAIIGGTVGGALGSDSRHQPLIAGAGAALGASIGHDVSHQRNAHSYYVTEEFCEVDYELRDREEVVGYRVSYRYGDSIYQTRTATRPGETIRLRVELQPLD
jgi:uncharacterized protein YcfJ